VLERPCDRLPCGGIPVGVSLRSMTGFGTASAPWTTDDGPASVDVELRSVNARYLELKVRQPFGAAVEQRLRKRLGQRLGRGRVDVTIAVRRTDPADAGQDGPGNALVRFGVDPTRVDRALAAAVEIRNRAPASLEVGPVNPVELLRVLTSRASGSGDGPTEAPEFLGSLVEQAADALVAFRTREGSALTEAIGAQADALERQVAALAATLPPEADRLAERLRQRLDELTARMAKDPAGGVRIDPDRLAPEVALVVARGDVTEELDRIASHLARLREVLGQAAERGQGKTLEFIAQELFREITTIGSKITSHEGSGIVIEAKGSIERIREQVQNVE